MEVVGALIGIGVDRGMSMLGLGGEEEKKLKIGGGSELGLGGEEEAKEEKMLLKVGVEGREFGFETCCKDGWRVRGGREEDEEESWREDDEEEERVRREMGGGAEPERVFAATSASCFISTVGGGSSYSVTCTALPNMYSCQISKYKLLKFRRKKGRGW